MSADLLTDLPAISRLALAYVSPAAKPATAALLALDHQLGSIARSTTEPMLAQLRYAWWRDVLTGVQGGRGNAVTAALDTWGERRSHLVALADGWEALVVADDLHTGALQLVEARAGAAGALAQVLGEHGAMNAASEVGRRWALGDLVQNLSEGPARTALLAQLLSVPKSTPSLPRALRSFAILAASTGQTMHNSTTNRVPALPMLLTIMRIGLFGR